MNLLPQISLEKIPSGYAGTLKTVQHIIDLLKRGAKDFYVRQTAIDILLQRAVKPKDYLGEIKALFEWVQQNVRYTKDTFRVEVRHSPRRMLQLRAGDCDDMAIVLGAMLEATGHPARSADPIRSGKLVGLIYRSDKGQPGQPRAYIHRMKDPPRLVSNIEGTQLYVVGGSYRVTQQGIEG